MPTRSEPWPAGTPCWVDINVPDMDAAKAFYGAVLGWSFQDLGEGFSNYNICQVDGRAAAAIGPLQYDGQPTAWMVYVASDDADATAKVIADNSGTVVLAPGDIPGYGRMCIAQDPQGATFAVWQTAGMHGTEVYMEPGSLVWTDVRTTDPDAAREFYAAVFGYRYQPTEGAVPNYTMVSFDGVRDGESIAGIGAMIDPAQGTPPHWLPYFIVADADAAADAARSTGGSLPGDPFDSPWGKMAPVTDPFGATFMVLGVPVQSG